MVETINKLIRTSRHLLQKNGREPTPEEIAEEMNISVRTVETHVYNALKIIRNNLKVLRLISAIIIFTTSTLF